jgi:hypothetical protein
MAAVERPAKVIRRNLSDLAHDVITLLELQASLFKLDMKDTAVRSIVPVAVLAGGLFVLIACLTVALAAMGYLLVEQGGLSFAASFGLAALGGALLGGILLAVGWLRLRHGFQTVSRSREEFARNLSWFKQVLKQNIPSHPREDWK